MDRQERLRGFLGAVKSALGGFVTVKSALRGFDGPSRAP